MKIGSIFRWCFLIVLARLGRVGRNGSTPAIFESWVKACEEKNRLAMECDVATLKFSEAVRELHRRMGTTPMEEYDRLERASYRDEKGNEANFSEAAVANADGSEGRLKNRCRHGQNVLCSAFGWTRQAYRQFRERPTGQAPSRSLPWW